MGTQSLAFLLHIILNKLFTMLTRYEWTPVHQIQRLFTKGALQKKKEGEKRTRKERAEVPTPSPLFLLLFTLQLMSLLIMKLKTIHDHMQTYLFSSSMILNFHKHSYIPEDGFSCHTDVFMCNPADFREVMTPLHMYKWDVNQDHIFLKWCTILYVFEWETKKIRANIFHFKVSWVICLLDAKAYLHG